MTGSYDELREQPDPQLAEALRQRLQAALDADTTASSPAAASSRADRDAEVLTVAPATVGTSRRTMARIAMVAAATVLVVVAALVAVSTGRDADLSPSGPVPTDSAPTTTASTTTTASSTTTTTSTTSTTIPPAPQPIPPELQFAPPGRYEFDELGVPVAFTNDVDYLDVLRVPSAVVFIEWDQDDPLPSPGDPLRSINFERVGSWYSREEALDNTFAGLGSIGPNDVDAWMADNPVIVDLLPDTTVGGRPARVFDARPDLPAGVTGDCLESFKPCLWLSTLSSAVVDTVGHHAANFAMASGFVSRFWLVDMGEFEPVLIKISAPVDDTAWFDEFESTVLASMTLGDPQPLVP